MGLGIAIALGETADPDLAGASWVEVTERMGEMTTYRLRYELDASGGDFALLTSAKIDVGSELSVIAPVGGVNNYLVKGPVTGQKVHFAHGASGSYVEVEGADTSIKLDRESKSAIWSDGTDSDSVRSIVSSHYKTADVDDTSAGHSEAKHTLVQRASDLQFVRQLARRNGCLFWISCDASGNETAHFRRPALDGDTALDLILNLTDNNIEWLELLFDVERPTSVDAAGLDLSDKSDIDGAVDATPLALLGSQGLADIAQGARVLHLAAPVDDSGDLKSRGEGALIDTGWFIRATCETTVSALKNVVRPQMLVNVRGIGQRHSGKYFVAAVKHTIDPSNHRMEMELVRNGWGN